MSGDSRWEVQQAVAARLLAVSAVTALVGTRIYDDVPDGEIAESSSKDGYLAIGPMSAVDDSDKSESGVAITFTISAFSTYRGFGRVRQIQAAVHGALHRHALSVTGHEVTLLQFLSSDEARDQDGLTRESLARYVVITEPS